ncbi:D-alanyl-D-alanine carboxypeptidase/D-alanyl-D-alanine-endopeptidase [Streptomyces sp. NPDC005963]|uniref:D-alanyl-D-alanine carboxypeptidase/D-alanyl-D-alanine endopeptidase n=1 Tax=Streptomyces sp. NPDC005963 TaxID=3156721 RepID=UPI0034083449
MPVVRTWQLAAGAAVVGLALAAGAVAAAGPWDSGQRKAEKQWAAAQNTSGGADHRRPVDRGPAPAPSAPGVLSAIGTARATAGPVDGKAVVGLGKELGALLRDPGLGPLRTASVVDVSTGRQLFGQGAATPMPPASTVKVATAIAALTALGPEHRIPTTAVLSADARELTLVGGGDATLSQSALATLADRTAKVLRERSATAVRLTYDKSLYRGPVRHRIGKNGNLAPVTALMVDQGRKDPYATGDSERVADPAGAAARAFEQLLEARGVRVITKPVATVVPRTAEPVARVLSAPLSALVERMLTDSDNDLAEALARQTALASRQEASFAGAGRAVHQRLAGLGLPLKGARLTDGSGLDRRARLSAHLLTALLSRAADPSKPELRSVLTGLPIAGFSGTLESRYADQAPGTGLVRAKTGTLTGVSSLAGTVVSADGRLLAFAFLAGKTPSRDEAQPVLDRLATALVS